MTDQRLHTHAFMEFTISRFAFTSWSSYIPQVFLCNGNGGSASLGNKLPLLWMMAKEDST